MTEKNS